MLEARRCILPERLFFWLDSGVTAIVHDRVRLVIEGGTVVTVIGPRKQTKRRRSLAEDMEIAA